MKSVKNLRAFSVGCIAAAVLAACGTTPAVPPVDPALVEGVKRSIPGGCASTGQPSMSNAAALANAMCGGIDVVGTLAQPASPATTVEYAETDAFEKALHQSLKGKHPIVTVNLAGKGVLREQIDIDVVYTDSPRIASWVSALKGKGGTVIACQERVPEMFWLLDWVIGAVVSQIDAWATYRPLNDYGAVALVYSPDANGAGELKSALFLRKDQPVQCPAGSLPLATAS